MKKKKITHSFNSLVVDDLSNNNELLETFILTIIEDYHETEDLSAFLISLKQVIESKGGMTTISEKTGINRQHLYKMFSQEGNPTFTNLMKVLKSLDLSINIGNKFSPYQINSELVSFIDLKEKQYIKVVNEKVILSTTDLNFGIKKNLFQELEVYVR